MIDFKKRIIEEWESNGFSAFRETIWSSSLQQDDLPTVRQFLANNNVDNVDVSLVVPPDDSTHRMKWVKHYEGSGQCISSLRKELIPANSNNLKLTFCYKSKEAEQNSMAQTVHIVNILRLVFGVPIARELLFVGHFYNDESPASYQSDEDFASVFDTQVLNMFPDPPIEKIEIKQIPTEATILLDKAFAQTYPTERFILMWLAFEAIVNSMPGTDTNGKKRKKYFQDDLQSDIINTEVYRLFQLRNDIFKEGKTFTNSSIEKECWSLYSIIQLSIMENCEQRKAFIMGYENTLTSE